MTTIPAVINFMAERTGRRPIEFQADRRNRLLAFHRQIAYWLCWHVTGGSLPAIGNAFARDHTTVLHGIRCVERSRMANEEVRMLTDHLLAQLGGNSPRYSQTVSRKDQPFTQGTTHADGFTNARPTLRVVA